MANEAAVNGISRFGSQWSSDKLIISKYTELIGEMEEPISPIEHEQLREHAYNIAQVLREFIDNLNAQLVKSDRKLSLLKELQEINMEDIEFLEELRDEIPLEGDLDDVRYALNRLYDTFDYHRVLVE